jgi:hypothetical protein
MTRRDEFEQILIDHPELATDLLTLALSLLGADQQATFLTMATATAAEMEKASAPTRQDQSTR